MMLMAVDEIATIRNALIHATTVICCILKGGDASHDWLVRAFASTACQSNMALADGTVGTAHAVEGDRNGRNVTPNTASIV